MTLAVGGRLGPYEVLGPLGVGGMGEVYRARDTKLDRQVAIVVERHLVPGTVEEGYSVEFFDMIGNTVAVITVPASALRLPTPTDRPAVRALRA